MFSPVVFIFFVSLLTLSGDNYDYIVGNAVIYSASNPMSVNVDNEN